jgi:tellurite resistance protein
MAYADGEFHPTEREVILSKMAKLFPQETNLETKLTDAEEEYLDQNKKKLKSLILDTFRHFKDVKFSAKYHVYADMYDVVHADGKVDETEREVLEELKSIIDLSAEAKA